jgi:hypothetical protein
MKVFRVLAIGATFAALVASSTACSSSSPSPRSTIAVPPRSSSSITVLQEYLATGKCRVEIAIWRESARTAAGTYVAANGAPTDLCHNPDVVIVVTADKTLRNGIQRNGRWIIRYDFTGPAISHTSPVTVQWQPGARVFGRVTGL